MTEKEMKERHGIDINDAEKLMKKYGLIDENATKEDVLKELELALNDEVFKKMTEKPDTKKIKKDLDEFVSKYNDLSEVHNRICPPESPFRRRPLIEGTYSVNEEGTIDIDGNFILSERCVSNVDRKNEIVLEREKESVFAVKEFPFKINRVTGDFAIFSRHLDNLDMFPRLIEGSASVNCRNAGSVRGISGSVIKGNCWLRSRAETLFFPDHVGGDLTVYDGYWLAMRLDKTFSVGGIFKFPDLFCQHPAAQMIKEKVQAAEYRFNPRIRYGTFVRR